MFNSSISLPLGTLSIIMTGNGIGNLHLENSEAIFDFPINGNFRVVAAIFESTDTTIEASSESDISDFVAEVQQ